MDFDIAYVFCDSGSRTEGLRGKELGFGQCALFVYDSPSFPRFWMKGVPYGLYLSSIVNGLCVESEYMEAETFDPHVLSVKTMCVVESRKSIPLGAYVDIDGERLRVR